MAGKFTKKFSRATQCRLNVISPRGEEGWFHNDIVIVDKELGELKELIRRAEEKS